MANACKADMCAGSVCGSSPMYIANPGPGRAQTAGSIAQAFMAWGSSQVSSQSAPSACWNNQQQSIYMAPALALAVALQARG